MNFYSLVSSIFINHCTPGQFECLGKKMQICSANSVWVIFECPKHTKCMKTDEVIQCTPGNDLIKIKKFVQREKPKSDLGSTFDSVRNVDFKNKWIGEGKEEDLLAIKKVSGKKDSENLKLSLGKPTKVKGDLTTSAYKLQKRDEGIEKSIITNSTSHLVDDPIEIHLNRDLVTSEQKLALSGQWESFDPDLYKVPRRITAVKDARTNNIIMSEPIPLETVIGRSTLRRNLKLKLVHPSVEKVEKVIK